MQKRALILAGLLLLAACGDTAEVVTSGDGVTQTKQGDTTIVVSTGDGVWGPVHDAVEVLRVVESSKETTLGQIQGMAAPPDGGVLVYDAKGAEGKIIRHFDANGKFVRNIGREGSGPGEYNFEAVRFAVYKDGSILVREPFRGVSRFAADGRYLDGFTMERVNSGHEVVAATDGSVYVRGTIGAEFRRVTGMTAAGHATMLRYDTKGTLLDSIRAPKPWLVTSEPPSIFSPAPKQTWFPLPDGRVIVGRTDRLGFLLLDGKGGNPLVAEVSVPPIVFADEERKELQEVAEWMELNYGLVEGGRVVQEGPKVVKIPETKMPAKSIEADIDGRIWIGKSTASVKVAPFVTAVSDGKSIKKSYAEQERRFVAFQLDGTYLGEVRFPMKTGQLAFVGDFAWAVTRNDDDVPVLVKYRLH